MAVRGADAVGAGIAAADHDYMLAGCHDLLFQLVAGIDLVLLRQKFHRKMHALQFAPRHRQIARLLGAACDDDDIEILLKLIGRHRFLGPVRDIGGEILTNQYTGAENDAFGFHLLDTAVNMRFLHLEIGNTVAQQAADAVVFLEHGDVMPGARKLLRGSQTGWAGTDHRHFLATLDRGRQRNHPAVFPALVDDEMLDRFDTDRLTIDVERTGRFAGRRADTPGEFRKVIGRMQVIQRFLVVAAINQIVPVRNDVIDRAAGIAERDAAVHAARALNFRLIIGQMQRKFLVMLGAFFGGLARFLQALELQKAGYFSHVILTNLVTGSASPVRRRTRLMRFIKDYAATFSAPALAVLAACISASARLYSVGKTLTNLLRAFVQSSSKSRARVLPVYLK